MTNSFSVCSFLYSLHLAKEESLGGAEHDQFRYQNHNSEMENLSCRDKVQMNRNEKNAFVPTKEVP
jgi:hypothetical protein